MKHPMTRRQFVQTGLAAAGLAAGGRAMAQNGQQPLTLVQGGRSDYQIVRPADATPSVIYAADELQRYIKAMTGADIPVVTDEGPPPPLGIFVGDTRHTATYAGARVRRMWDSEDAFAVETRTPHLIIDGSPVRGVLYGVYHLLEAHGGCRWYSSFHEVVPQRRDWTVPPLEEYHAPAFAMREPFWYDMMVNGDFAARSRANGNAMRVEEKHGGHLRFGTGYFVHTFNRLVPPGEFFATHPEYFSEIEGKRVAERSQLCLTNPAVLDLVTERLLAAIREDPTAKLFSVSQNDWHGYCTCPSCRAVDEREGSPSGTMIQFVNQVAEAVEREFPQVWIETLAYQYTRHPPKTLVPRANVVPRLCTIECDFSRPLADSPYEQNTKFVDDIEGWSAITDKLYIWDYTTNFGHYIGPHPNFNALQGNVQFFRDHGVVGLFEQGAYQGMHGEFAELRAWLLAKLLWDPDQPIEPLYDDFFTGYYGPAAEPVREYWTELQSLAYPPEHVLRIWSPMTSEWYSDEFFDRASTLFAAAEERAAGDDDLLHRVKMSGIPVLYAQTLRRPRGAATFVLAGDRLLPEGGDPADRAQLAELLERVETGKVRICENETIHRERLTDWRARTRGLELTMLTDGELRLGVTPELGGRPVALSLGDGPSYLSFDGGGVDLVDQAGALAGDSRAVYVVKKEEPASLELEQVVRHRFALRRTLGVTDGAATVVTTAHPLQPEPRTFNPLLRAAIDLGNVDRLVVRAGGREWSADVPADQMTGVLGLPVEALADEVLFASPVTARGLRLRAPAEGATRALVQVNAGDGTARLYVQYAPTELHPGSTLSWPVALAPVASVEGLERAQPVGEHRANRAVIEDAFFSLGRTGEWGEPVPDQAAEDGWAAKLHNTHYEWSLQWRVDPSVVEPGARYRARARVRVDKTPGAAGDGEAFWAGIYDTERKKGWGQVQPKLADVSDGYAWYDLGEWVPEAGQYIWVGPGRFDKEALTAHPGHTGVFVDRFELERIE